MRAVLLVLACGGLLLGTEGRASRCSRFSCFCLDDRQVRQSTGTIEATIVAIDGPQTQFVLQTPRGVPGSYVAGGMLDLPREKADLAGGRWLLFFADGNFQSRMELSATGTVTCPYDTPGYTLPAIHAHDLFMRQDCQDALDARGYQQQCGPPGCGCSSGGLSALAMLILGLGLGARRRPPA